MTEEQRNNKKLQIEIDKLKKEVMLLNSKINKEENEKNKYIDLYSNSLNQIELMFEKNSSSIVIVNPDTGDIVDANESALKFYGFSKNKFLKKKFQDMCIEVKNAPKNVFLDDLKFKNKKFVCQHKISRGNIKFVEIHSTQAKYFDNKVIFLIIHDISDRKIIENQLLESEESLKDIFNSVKEGIAYTTLSGKVLTMNTALEKILEIPKEAIINKNILIIATELLNRKSLNSVITILSDLISGREIKPFIIEVKNKFLEISAYHNKKTKRIIGVILDITKRKIDEANILRNMEFNNALMKSIPVPIFFKNANGFYLGCNDKFTEMMGVSNDDIIGKSVMELWPSDQAEVYHFRDLELLKHPENQVYQSKVTDKNGKILDVIFNKVVFFDENGKVAGIVGAYQDITEIKNTQNELILAKEKAEESDKLKSAFLQNISHEIRTPLNGILGFSNLLNSEDTTNEEIKEFTSIINNSGARLLEIINNVIDISKIETKQIIIEKNNFYIQNLFEGLFTDYEKIAIDKGLILKNNFNPSDNILSIYSDYSRLFQIMSNLINNAIKFTENGIIEIGFKNEKEYIFYVKDTGIGIPEDRIHIIFQRFVQVNLAISRGYEGAGIGLSICKGLVDLLGGNIWFESEEGKGTTFIISLPKK